RADHPVAYHPFTRPGIRRRTRTLTPSQMFDTFNKPTLAAPSVGQGSVLLADGHRGSVTFAGRGLPFVFVHGFLLSGPRHADLLRGLAGLGFRAIALD